VDGEDAALVAGEQIIDEIADDGVWFVTELCHHTANQRAAASMPLQINGAVKVPRAMDLRPTMRPAGLLRPDFDEAELSIQLRIAHDLVAQRTAAGRNDLNYRLHPRSQFGLTSENYKRQLL
jgi:hypothetical protein